MSSCSPSSSGMDGTAVYESPVVQKVAFFRHRRALVAGIISNMSFMEEKVPPSLNASLGTAALHSGEEWSDPIQGGNKKGLFLSNTNAQFNFRINSMEGVGPGPAQGGALLAREGNTLGVSSTLDPVDHELSLKSCGRWSQPWLFGETGKLELHRCRLERLKQK